jgi:hypothetical protein
VALDVRRRTTTIAVAGAAVPVVEAEAVLEAIKAIRTK